MLHRKTTLDAGGPIDWNQCNHARETNTE